MSKPTTERAVEEVWLDRDAFRPNSAKYAGQIPGV